MVNALEDYQWSSYPAYLKQVKAPDWLYRDTVYSALGIRRGSARYAAYVNVGNDEETAQFYQKKQTPAFMSEKAFKERLLAQPGIIDKGISQQGLSRLVSIESIVDAVATHYKVKPENIVVAKRGKIPPQVPRWVAMKICQEVGSAKLEVIARAFHVGHYSTVSQTIGRLNRLMGEDKRVWKVYNMLSQDLTRKSITAGMA